MKQRNKWLQSLLCVLLIAAMLMSTACSAKTVPAGETDADSPPAAGSASEPQPETKEDPTELTVAFYSYVADPVDLGKVQDYLNKMLEEKINCHVTLMPISAADYTSKINLMLQNGDKLDLLVTGTGLNYYVEAASGQLKAMDDLLASNGSGITDVLGVYLDSTRMPDGSVYAVPVYQSYSAGTTFIMRKDILDKYDLSAADIKTLDDLEKVFEVVHENEPGLACVLPEDVGQGVFGLGCDVLYDPLGDSLGVLPNYGQDATVQDIFQTQEYKDWVYRLRDWYNKGYILPDIATNREATASLLLAGTGFGHFTGVCVDPAFVATGAYGMPMEAVTFGEKFVGSSNVATICWAIASQCEHPDKAMDFLNLLYTDADVVNTLCYGIESEHYIVSNGFVSYPEGIDLANHPYNFGLNYLWGNTFLAYLPVGYSADYNQKAQEANEQAKVSIAMGFVYDNSNVLNEIAAAYNVVTQYMGMLGSGSVDPEIYLPEFIQKLQDAGIDKIVAEKQAQFTAWMENK